MVQSRAAPPVATLSLIAVNIACFVVELSLGDNLDPFIRRWGLVPADAGEPAALITLLTSTFLHGGWLHLLSNMIYLGVFGPPVEDRLGGSRFVGLYLLSALLGSLIYLLAQRGSQTPAIGASGAIAGVIGAHLLLYPGATLGSVSPVLSLRLVEGTPTLVLLVIWLATQLLSGVASLTTTTGIAWWAHLGGFASGIVLAPILRPRTVRRS
ncbi:MAG: rhomboid family intramembrane serine protease [Chloroflexi bacterium]|nr:rhomboid family intramembrane serine protease [Chloroflexota bacterium]